MLCYLVYSIMSACSVCNLYLCQLFTSCASIHHVKNVLVHAQSFANMHCTSTGSYPVVAMVCRNEYFYIALMLQALRYSPVGTLLKYSPVGTWLKYLPVDTWLKYSQVGTWLKYSPVGTWLKYSPVGTWLKYLPVGTWLKYPPVGIRLKYPPVGTWLKYPPVCT